MDAVAAVERRRHEIGVGAIPDYFVEIDHIVDGAFDRIHSLTSFLMRVFSAFQPVLVPFAGTLCRGMMVTAETLMPWP